MNKPRTVRLICTKAFYLLALVIFTWCYLSGFRDALGRKGLILISFVIFAAIVGLGCALVYHFRSRITARSVWLLLAIGLFGMALLQYKFATLFMVEPVGDFNGIFMSAIEYATTGKLESFPHYFEQFPNNWGLLVWFIGYFRLLFHLGMTAVSDFLRAGVILNCVVIDTSVLLLVAFCKKVWGCSAALIALGLSLLFTPFYLYVPIFYTDTMSLIFPPLALLLLYTAQHRSGRVPQLLLYLLLGVVLAFGSKVKGNLMVLLVAFIIYLLFQIPFRRGICCILALVVSFGCFSAAFDTAVEHSNIVDMESIDTYQFPKEFWLYMGLSNPGGFNGEDFDTIRFKTSIEEKRETARAGIQRRLHNYGVRGLFSHLTTKLGYTYGDGGYYICQQLQDSPLKRTKLSEYVYANQPNSYVYLSIAGGYHFLLGLILLAGLLTGLVKKRNFSFSSLCYLVLLGVFLFLMIWETRSRYWLNVTPVMLILCAVQLNYLFDRITAHFPKHPAE